MHSWNTVKRVNHKRFLSIKFLTYMQKYGRLGHRAITTVYIILY